MSINLETLGGGKSNPFTPRSLNHIREGNIYAQYEQPPVQVPHTVVDFDGSLAGEIGKPGVIYRRAHPQK